MPSPETFAARHDPAAASAGRYLWLDDGTSAGDGSGPKTRYHLLTTDGGITADQPGKAAAEAAIGVV